MKKLLILSLLSFLTSCSTKEIKNIDYIPYSNLTRFEMDGHTYIRVPNLSFEHDPDCLMRDIDEILHRHESRQSN